MTCSERSVGNYLISNDKSDGICKAVTVVCFKILVYSIYLEGMREFRRDRLYCVLIFLNACQPVALSLYQFCRMDTRKVRERLKWSRTNPKIFPSAPFLSLRSKDLSRCQHQISFAVLSVSHTNGDRE
jgi:hypothetical protein